MNLLTSLALGTVFRTPPKNTQLFKQTSWTKIVM